MNERKPLKSSGIRSTASRAEQESGSEREERGSAARVVQRLREGGSTALSSGEVLTLQRTLGNRSAGRLLSSSSAARPDAPIQAMGEEGPSGYSWLRPKAKHDIEDSPSFSWREKRSLHEVLKGDRDVRNAVSGTIFGSPPSKVERTLEKRYPKGPLLSHAEWNAIKAISKSLPGMQWLEAAGLLTVTQAKTYLQKGDFRRYNQLPGPTKLVLASYYDQHREFPVIGSPPPPPYSVYLSATNQTDRIDELTGEQWAQTLMRGEWTPEAQYAVQAGAVVNPKNRDQALNGAQVLGRHQQATQVLRNVFYLLHSQLELYAGKKNQGQYQLHTGNVAKVLSHGGRVNIRIPALGDSKENPHALMEWLGITHEAGELDSHDAVFSRLAGTHHVRIGDNKAGQSGSFKETGGMMAAINAKLHFDHLMGMNLAVGGLGKKDFNGDVILPDGAHGHMFIGFREPTLKRDGVLQIGIETTEPGGFSTVGYIHNWRSSEKTANPVSSVGGLKKDKVGDGSKNARTIDLAKVGEGDWKKRLDEIRSHFEGKLSAAQDEQAQKEVFKELTGPSISLKK
ncbi:hypothetical protein [Stigmatella aurantiaca]|uniref:Novel toxin 11 domain-containing protein n=1 Tax=Stigmatella aurantiaca (strain DW4/3-1) TaxID=378806 RepID=Q09DF7_STIAD|nr:hypothetical protein [Stigmatella aurantiaca]ADO69354.1 uncharacterized protein STAUR_1550 [Stigmatella aurantiaca DW4/3-1]EAU69824.1 hypothetical protein STIAU_1527 [Stigmatella aurantiaca DW4/3-1]